MLTWDSATITRVTEGIPDDRRIVLTVGNHAGRRKPRIRIFYPRRDGCFEREVQPYWQFLVFVGTAAQARERAHVIARDAQDRRERIG